MTTTEKILVSLEEISEGDYCALLDRLLDLTIAEADQAKSLNVVTADELTEIDGALKEIQLARGALVAELRRTEAAGQSRIAARIFRVTNAVRTIAMIANASKSAKDHGYSEGQARSAGMKKSPAWHDPVVRLATKKLGERPNAFKADLIRLIRESSIKGLPASDRQIDRVLSTIPAIAARKKK